MRYYMTVIFENLDKVTEVVVLELANQMEIPHRKAYKRVEIDMRSMQQLKEFITVVSIVKEGADNE